MPDRKSFGKIREVIQPPNLIENQINSYLEFLQKDVPIVKRQNIGLEAVFRELFPIESYDGQSALEYVSFSISEPKMSEMECLREGVTYSIALNVVLRFIENGLKNKKKSIWEKSL